MCIAGSEDWKEPYPGGRTCNAYPEACKDPGGHAVRPRRVRMNTGKNRHEDREDQAKNLGARTKAMRVCSNTGKALRKITNARINNRRPGRPGGPRTSPGEVRTNNLGGPVRKLRRGRMHTGKNRQKSGRAGRRTGSLVAGLPALIIRLPLPRTNPDEDASAVWWYRGAAVHVCFLVRARDQAWKDSGGPGGAGQNLCPPDRLVLNYRSRTAFQMKVIAAPANFAAVISPSPSEFRTE